MNKKKIFIVVIILVLFLVGSTFAYFQATGGNLNFSGSSGDINISYTNNGVLQGTLYPSESKTNDLMSSVNLTLNDDSVLASCDIFIEITSISESLASDALIWEVYVNDVYYSSGTFSGASSSSDFVLISDYPLSYNNTSFDVYVWLDGNNSGNGTMNSSFSGKLRARASAKAEFN